MTGRDLLVYYNMNKSPEYLAAEQFVESLISSGQAKIRKNDILFLKDGIPFAGITKAGVWMCVSKIKEGKYAGKNWYSYMSSIEEEKFGLDKMKYSETCDLAKEFVRKYLVLGD